MKAIFVRVSHGNEIRKCLATVFGESRRLYHKDEAYVVKSIPNESEIEELQAKHESFCIVKIQDWRNGEYIEDVE